VTEVTRPHAASRRLRVLLLAALTALAALLFGAGTASASSLPAAETRVGVWTLAAPEVVGVHECITAGQHWARGPSQLRLVVGHCVAAEDGARLASRTDELTGALDPIAQNSRTSAVMSTRQGADVLASGGRDLSPAQPALGQGDDVLGRLPGAHAEMTAMDAAGKAGLTPWQMAVSRPICPACQSGIEGSGGTVAPGGMFAWWPW